MPSSYVFDLDRPEPIYYSGETINGRINLRTTSEKSCREVYIQFLGEAKVRWEEERSETRDGKTEYYTDYFTGNETYIRSRTNVFGEGKLPPGLHTYTFCIQIPLEAPSSCIERYGQISYEVSLVINRSFHFDNVYRQPLTVLKQSNLNLSPQYLIPLSDEDVKYFCCGPCSSGPVISTLTIPFGGYAPGQSIKYSLHIDNQAHGYDLDGIELFFEQTYKFTAHSPHHKIRSHSVSLAKTGRNEIVRRLSKRLLEGTLVIPPVPPTSQNSGIITVSYQIKMDIKTGDCHQDSQIYIPIIIGTMPLVQSATNPENIALVIPSAPTPDTPGYDPDKPPSYDLIKPPSFEEATTITNRFVDTDVDEHSRIAGFIPKYPMYSNFALPTAPPAAAINNDAPNVPILVLPPFGNAQSTTVNETSSSMLPYPSSSNLPPYPTHDIIESPLLNKDTSN